MDDFMKQKTINELQYFYKKLRSYQNRQKRRIEGEKSEAKDRSLNALRLELQREYGRCGNIISQQASVYIIPHSEDMHVVFSVALDSLDMSQNALIALETAISIVNTAIGLLESSPEYQLNESKTESTSINLFDMMQFHSKVIEASRDLFIDGHYKDAIYRAFVETNNYVKEKTGIDDDGKSLMSNVFNCKNPVIKLNNNKTQSEKDEQEGFMHLFMGAMQGIRNPRAHENLSQRDPLRTLEYLAFASLLMKRCEEGKAEKIPRPRKQWDLDKFLADAEKRCPKERFEVIKKLIDFTTQYSEGGILWGQGATYGTFAFRKQIDSIPSSIYLIYSDGTVFLNFGSLKNRGVIPAILELFRTDLNKIPNVNINRETITKPNGTGSMGLKPLVNPDNFTLFQKAILTLCRRIDNQRASLEVAI